MFRDARETILSAVTGLAFLGLITISMIKERLKGLDVGPFDNE
jgi:hypothetical protein